MDQATIERPATPIRQNATSPTFRHPAIEPFSSRMEPVSQRTPATGLATLVIPGEPSFNTSSSGDDSLVLHSLSDQTSGSGGGLESSFEALHLSQHEPASTDSSVEIIVHSSPPSTGFFAFPKSQGGISAGLPGQVSERHTSSGGGIASASKEVRHSRQSSLAAIDEKKELAVLSPIAREFAPDIPPPSNSLDTFKNIVAFGKDEYGQLTNLAKEALARLGLKPIPSLHGPLNLPYARCASGIDAIVPNDTDEAEPWGDDENEDGGGPNRSQRAIPLPGNSRYTQAGRLAMRYSSAPAALQSGSKRTNPPTAGPRPNPANTNFVSKARKFSPTTRPPPAPPRQPVKSTVQETPSEIPPVSTQSQHAAVAQLEIDAQAFARAQAMQNYFLHQAQLAQFLGAHSTAELLAAQHSPGDPNLLANANFSRTQSPNLPAFQPFSPSPGNASPGLLSQQMLSASSSRQQHQQHQKQSLVDPSSQVDSISLLKLAGQRRLGLSSLPYPIPQVNIDQQSQSVTAGLGLELDDNGDRESLDAIGGRQSEQATDLDATHYDRSAVPFTVVERGTSGGNGYDFLRRSASQDRHEGKNRRNSSSTRFEQQGRPAYLTKPTQDTRRRRSAAPAMPYPGHSLRKSSTSSIVTVNSTLPGPVPQVRIFSDPSSPSPPPKSTFGQRRGSTPSGRPLEDLVNTQKSSAVPPDQKPLPSAAQTSTNWRRPSLPSNDSELKQPLAGPSSSSAMEPSPQVPSHAPRGRGRGGRGRKNTRGAFRPRGQNPAA
ncbi:hypothetical protein JCM16303_007091 [Sporobolomyces ruberrimus]